VDFEKDVDENYHIDFIHYASDCRAFNYDLKSEEHSREKTKVIAGKILAAVLTTTAAVTGLCGAELIKMVSGKKHKSQYKSGNMNLARNEYNIFTPF
jgi:ubiquitin-activating enzyme E1